MQRNCVCTIKSEDWTNKVKEVHSSFLVCFLLHFHSMQRCVGCFGEFLKNLPGQMWNHSVKQQTIYISSLSVTQKVRQKATTKETQLVSLLLCCNHGAAAVPAALLAKALLTHQLIHMGSSFIWLLRSTSVPACGTPARPRPHRYIAALFPHPEQLAVQQEQLPEGEMRVFFTHCWTCAAAGPGVIVKMGHPDGCDL